MRTEIYVSYSRIQDIQLVSGFVERWLGLARIHVQTASGSASPEMTLEGIKAYEQLRDFIYARTRGARNVSAGSPVPVSTPAPNTFHEQNTFSHVAGDETNETLAQTLHEIASELRMIRSLLQGAGSSSAEPHPEPHPTPCSPSELPTTHGHSRPG